MSEGNETLIERIIRERRTIKPAAMDPERDVTRSEVQALLESANWAPTHGLTEPWRFHVYMGEARPRLASDLADIYLKTTPLESQRPEKLEKLKAQPLMASVVIVVSLHRDEKGKIAEIEEIEAVACAVQNICLAATARGIGSFWSSPPLIYTDAVIEYLNLSKDDRCLGLLYLGRPRDGISVTGIRRPVSEKTLWFS